MSSRYARLREYLFLQEGDNSCAVAALRTVLALQFAVVADEDQLEVLGSYAKNPIAQHGTDNSALRRMVKNASTTFNINTPWKLKVKSKATIKELRAHIRAHRYPIVTVTTVFPSFETQLHAVVILDVTDSHVVVHDPARAAPVAKRHTHAAFLKWWTIVNGNTEYVVVTGGEPLPTPALDS